MFWKFLKNFIILLLTFTILGLSVYLFLNYFFYEFLKSLPTLFDIGLNNFLHNEPKPIPFESYDATEYIVAESEESARKRALEAASAAQWSNSLFYISCTSIAFLIVSTYLGYPMPLSISLPITYFGLSIVSTGLVGATEWGRSSPGTVISLHAISGALNLALLNPICPKHLAVFLPMDALIYANSFILCTSRIIFEDVPRWVHTLNAFIWAQFGLSWGGRVFIEYNIVPPAPPLLIAPIPAPPLPIAPPIPTLHRRRNGPMGVA